MLTWAGVTLIPKSYIHSLGPLLDQGPGGAHITRLVTLTLVTSGLDFCNALYLPLRMIQKLQLVENATAQGLSGKSRFHYATPILKLLWLPVICQAQFKVLIMLRSHIWPWSRLSEGPAFSTTLCLAIKIYWRSLSPSPTYVRGRLLGTRARVCSIAVPQMWNHLPKGGPPTPFVGP